MNSKTSSVLATNKNLIELAKLMGFEPNQMELKNGQEYRIIYQLWNRNFSEIVGQIESRVGSPYSDQPNGFSAYMEGYNWTNTLPTVEECYQQLINRRQNAD